MERKKTLQRQGSDGVENMAGFYLLLGEGGGIFSPRAPIFLQNFTKIALAVAALD